MTYTTRSDKLREQIVAKLICTVSDSDTPRIRQTLREFVDDMAEYVQVKAELSDNKYSEEDDDYPF